MQVLNAMPKENFEKGKYDELKGAFESKDGGLMAEAFGDLEAMAT
jgi:hypothetical protein